MTPDDIARLIGDRDEFTDAECDCEAKGWTPIDCAFNQCNCSCHPAGPADERRPRPDLFGESIEDIKIVEVYYSTHPLPLKPSSGQGLSDVDEFEDGGCFVSLVRLADGRVMYQDNKHIALKRPDGTIKKYRHRNSPIFNETNEIWAAAGGWFGARKVKDFTSEAAAEWWAAMGAPITEAVAPLSDKDEFGLDLRCDFCGADYRDDADLQITIVDDGGLPRPYLLCVFCRKNPDLKIFTEALGDQDEFRDDCGYCELAYLGSDPVYGPPLNLEEFHAAHLEAERLALAGSGDGWLIDDNEFNRIYHREMRKVGFKFIDDAWTKITESVESIAEALEDKDEFGDPPFTTIRNFLPFASTKRIIEMAVDLLRQNGYDVTGIDVTAYEPEGSGVSAVNPVTGVPEAGLNEIEGFILHNDDPKLSHPNEAYHKVYEQSLPGDVGRGAGRAANPLMRVHVYAGY